MASLTYVWADLTAFHTDPIGEEGHHAHTWRVIVYFRSKPLRDGRLLKAALVEVLAPYEGKDLPAAWWAAEDLAFGVFQLLAEQRCVGVRIEREEGFGALVGLCG